MSQSPHYPRGYITAPLPHLISCFFQEQKVMVYAPDGTPQQIGWRLEAYDELKAAYDGVYAIAEQYRQRLEDLGEIEKEMTPEEIIREQQDQIRESREAMQIMMAKIEELTAGGGKNEHSGTDSKNSRASAASAEHGATGGANNTGVSGKQGGASKGNG